MNTSEQSSPCERLFQFLPTRTTKRRRQPELLDQPGVDFADHESALVGLRRINVLSRTSSFLWPAIARLGRERNGSDPPIRLLDLATGGGDIPIALTRRASRSGIRLQIDGFERNPQAVQFARARARACGAAVNFSVYDALRSPLPSGYDVVTCSLFLHHLDESDAMFLLRQMAGAGGMVLVDDLIRSRRAYFLAWIGCQLLSRSHIVHHDGPLSVASAFTPGEALWLASRAGLFGATITRHWPYRYLLTWRAT